jgi:hypothetical protein
MFDDETWTKINDIVDSPNDSKPHPKKMLAIFVKK